MSHLLGCDVSSWQNPALVDWTKRDFGIVRATYGTMRDKSTVEHVKRVAAAGARAGLYHFFRADQGIADQADAFGLQLAHCEAVTVTHALDIEDFPGHKIGPADAEAARKFLDRFPGVTWMIYVTQRDWHRLGKPAWMLQHPLWVAHYPRTGATSPLAHPATPNGAPWAIWQCLVGPLNQRLQSPSHPQAVDQNIAVDPLPLLGELPIANPPTVVDEHIPYVTLDEDYWREYQVARDRQTQEATE